MFTSPTDKKQIGKFVLFVIRANELDNKSISGTGSRRSNDSSDTQSGVDGNFQTQLTVDESEDLWTIWGNLVKNWDVEFKKRPQYVKVIKLFM